jgi:hypothetical protein
VSFVVETPAGPFLYAGAGAVDAAAPVTSFERAPIDSNGGIGSWQTLAASADIVGGGVAVSDRLVFITGGFRGDGASAETNVGRVGDDGSLTLEAGPDMLSRRYHHSMVQHDGWAYVVGGFLDDQRSIAEVERARIDPEHGLGPWIADHKLPTARSHHAVVAHDGALYVVAGFNRQAADAPPGYVDENFADVLRSAIQSDGSLGEWTKVGALPKPLAIFAAFVRGEELYVVGGLEGPTKGGMFIEAVRRATIKADGTVGTFEEVPAALPEPRGHCHQAPVYGTAVYSIGGASEDGLQMKSQPDAFFARFE